MLVKLEFLQLSEDAVSGIAVVMVVGLVLVVLRAQDELDTVTRVSRGSGFWEREEGKGWDRVRVQGREGGGIEGVKVFKGSDKFTRGQGEGIGLDAVYFLYLH